MAKSLGNCSGLPSVNRRDDQLFSSNAISHPRKLPHQLNLNGMELLQLGKIAKDLHGREQREHSKRRLRYLQEWGIVAHHVIFSPGRHCLSRCGPESLLSAILRIQFQ